MSTDLESYIEFKPGELIAAEVMNEMQRKIRSDIGEQAQGAVDGIKQVLSAQNAEKLDGQSLADITQAIIDQAINQITERSGYMRLYKNLTVGRDVVIEHNLKNKPLVDMYQLDYFQVVASEDDAKYLSWVNFYLYYSGEKRIRFTPEGGTSVSVEIEPTDGEPHRILFADMLARYQVEYTEESSLGEIVEELWDAIFSAPNDRFDDRQYTKSPWFDRCCMEERTVKTLKQRGHWDDMWMKIVPIQTFNYPVPLPDGNNPGEVLLPMPNQIGVTHYNFNKMGLRLFAQPAHRAEVVQGLEQEGRSISEELTTMILLRA